MMAADGQYDLQDVRLPRLAGRPLRLFVRLLEQPATRGLLLRPMLRTGGIVAFRKLLVADPPTLYPVAAGVAAVEPAAASPAAPQGLARPAAPGFHFSSVRDYAEAYRAGRTTPEEVAERVLAALAASEALRPPLRMLIASLAEDVRRQARAAGQRLRAGVPLSLFDGVPVAVKDELHQQLYPTSVGTRFLGHQPAQADATVVARLRAAGAVLIGKTNMHEFGSGVTGLNVQHGSARNPYNPQHYPGGSSSGSAAAVAAGLCPVALGVDSGGSIRIPAALCGVVGLKPTFGRVSNYGSFPISWSMAHIGPLGACVEDVALAYQLIAGPDPHDRVTLRQPELAPDSWRQPELHGLRLGVYWPWFRHASPAVVSICEALLAQLERMGARIVEVVLPQLEAARVAHLVTIACDMLASLQPYYAAHHSAMGLDVRANLALARGLQAFDYLHAQRLRTRTIAHFSQALAQCDAIVTPATAMTAPRIPADALSDGESDLTTLVGLMRFPIPANLTGLPAISFPAGYDQHGLPVGLQAIGRAWEEQTLLRLACAAEPLVQRQAPQVHYRLLPETQA